MEAERQAVLLFKKWYFMSKNILIINEYTGSLKHGMTFRHYYLAKEFIQREYKTTIVTASYSHFLKKFPDMENKTYKKEDIDEIKYIWIKVIKYSKSFDKKRVFKWFEFMIKLFFLDKYLDDKPDVILCSPTALFSILPAYYLSKKYNAKLIFEVRDIWPLTLVELGGISKKNPLVKLMSWLEKFALEKSDIVVSNLQNYSSHIKDLGIDKKAYWVSNGINLDEMKDIEPLPQEVEKEIPKEKFIVGYTGKLGVSNAIDYLVDTARILKDSKEVYFVIVGNGQEKDKLKLQAKGLGNIIFINSIPKSQVQSMLNLFDVCFIGLHKEKIFKYGVSPNKLFDYMYSAKPIIHSINTTDDIVSLYNCGISVEAESSLAIQKAIKKLFEMDKSQRDYLGNNGKNAVLENFTYSKLAKKYINIIEEK